MDAVRRNIGGFDIDAREAEIIGKPERIAPLQPEEFDAEATALVIKVRKALGIDEMDIIPSVFGVMLRKPGLFRCQMELGVELLGKGDIPARERELAILRCGWLCGAPYEWGEHVDISKRYGVTAEEVERVTQGSSAEGWSDHDRAVVKAVEELIEERMISDTTWEILSLSWSERQLLELPILIGQYFTIAIQQNSLRVRLASDNPGLRHR
jgi:4-carboxymuconolactone decarboxylase